jgi:hypothetical protein
MMRWSWFLAVCAAASLAGCGGDWNGGSGSSGGSWMGGGSNSGSGGEDRPNQGGRSYVSGVVTPSSDLGVPRGAKVIVRLIDRNKGEAIGSQTMEVGKRGFPVPFQIRYNRDDIKEKRVYEIEARVKVKDRVKWMSRDRYAVITQGNPSYNLQVVVEPN